MATSAPKKRAVPKKTEAQLAAVQTRGDRLIAFTHKYVYVPEGALVGQKMNLLPEQQEFIHAVYDNINPKTNKLRTRRGIFSIARKNGKTGLIAALLEGHIIGPESKPNSQLYSAARSRDQASLVFNYAAKSLRLNPKLEGLVQITDSAKKIVGLRTNAVYKALSADATTAHGLSPALSIHDELGQVVGPKDNLYDALETAGGAQEEPLSLIISTQAASDIDLLSTLIDDGIRENDPRTVVRLYAAAKEANIFDPHVWYACNFALGKFRSFEDLKEFADRAKRMPAFEATFRNLYLNMRVALTSLLIPPSLWKECGELEPDDSIFFSGLPVTVALDLSMRTDLTAAVCACHDPHTGVMHTKTFVYAPLTGVEERAKRDRVPYELWAQQGFLVLTPGKIVDYAQVAEHLKENTDGMNITHVGFDRWRIDIFKKAALDAGWCTDEEIEWTPIGQGFRDMSPVVESIEALIMNRSWAHGNNPLLNMAAGAAISVSDPAGNRKMDKSKASKRIDPLVAASMAIRLAVAPPGEHEDTVGTENDFVIA